jgi:hypothetical protein
MANRTTTEMLHIAGSLETIDPGYSMIAVLNRIDVRGSMHWQKHFVDLNL